MSWSFMGVKELRREKEREDQENDIQANPHDF